MNVPTLSDKIMVMWLAAYWRRLTEAENLHTIELSKALFPTSDHRSSRSEPRVES